MTSVFLQVLCAFLVIFTTLCWEIKWAYSTTLPSPQDWNHKNVRHKNKLTHQIAAAKYTWVFAAKTAILTDISPTFVGNVANIIQYSAKKINKKRTTVQHFETKWF